MPATAEVPREVLRKIKQIEIKARVLADENLMGRYRSVFRGWGLEFEEVREYEAGDDIRSIDWNVTARMDAPYIKKFREERELSVILAVDVSASSWFGTVETSKRGLAADVAALLAFAALRSNDRVALLLFSDGIELYLPPRKGRDHLLRLVRELVLRQPRRTSTNIASAAEFIAKVAKKRSVVFLISDFLDEGYEASVRIIGRKHDVVGVTLDDPREKELPAVGVVGLEDAETGEVRYIDTGSRKVRERYALAAIDRRETRLRAFGRMGIDRVELSTDRPYVAALIALFKQRSKRR